MLILQIHQRQLSVSLLLNPPCEYSDVVESTVDGLSCQFRHLEQVPDVVEKRTR